MRTPVTNCVRLPLLKGQQLWLTARVTATHTIEDRRHEWTSTRVELGDYSGSIMVSPCWQLDEAARGLQVNQLIEARINAGSASPGIDGLLVEWRPLTPKCVLNAALTLPFDACPIDARQALATLAREIETLSIWPIRQACNELLLSAYPRLLTARASWRDHHNSPGGLLVHTTEVIAKARDEARYIFMGDEARDNMMCLIAIAHDLAKAELHNGHTANTFSKGLDHKLASLSMVSPVLYNLADSEPELGRLAGRMLAWLMQHPRDRKLRVCPEAEILQRADEFSAMADITRRRTWPALYKGPYNQAMING